MKKILLFLFFLLMSIGMWGATETITLSDFGWSNASVQSSISSSVSTIALAKNSAGTAPTYYTSDGLRLYGVKNKTTGCSISFTAKTNITITSIAFTHTSTNSGVLEASTGSYTNKTWTGTLTAGNIVTFKTTNTGNQSSNPQVRITQIVITYSASASYTIDAQSNNTSYGTVSLSGSVITGLPNSGCTYDSPAYTVTAGTASVSQNGNAFTVTPSSDCTVRINFKPITYTVTYDGNGNTGGSTPIDATEYTVGASVTTLVNTFTKDGYTFNGWNTQAGGGGTGYDEGDSFTIDANTTLYAQWIVTPIVAGRVYELVTDIDELSVNDNIIILDVSKAHALSTTQNTNNRGSSQDFRPIMNKTVVVLNEPTTVQVMRLGKTGDNWTFYIWDNGYLYADGSPSGKNSNNHLKTQATNNINGQWSITIDENTYESLIVAQGSNTNKTMQYNSGSNLFSCYASASQTNLHIYKQSTFSEKYTITFVNQLGLDFSKTQTDLGEIITLPSSVNTSNKCYNPDWTLEGWATSLDATESSYTGEYIPTQNTTLYALYGRGSHPIELDEYELLTSTPDDWAGDYLITHTDGVNIRIADGRIGGTSTGGIGASGVYVTPGTHLHGGTTIDAEWGDSYNITLEEISEGSGTYLLKTQDGAYNYSYNNTTGLQNTNTRSTAEQYPISPTFVSSTDVQLSIGGAVFRYNPSGFFKFYKNCGQQPVYFYKKQKVTKYTSTEYSTAPECDSSFITTWNKDKILIDKGLSYDLTGKTVTIKDINTDETLANNVSATYDNSTDLYQINATLTGKECDKINIFITNNSTDSTYLIYKVPFIVDTDVLTTSIVDENCDVVVLPDKKLTVSGTDSEHRDVKLYGGAHLSVPSGTEYTVNSLSLRRDNLTTSTLGLTGTLNANNLYFDLYVDASDWYWVCLPDAFNLSNLKYANGRNPVYKSNYWVRWYDGEHRAATQSASWKDASSDATFQKGNGFIFGLNDNLIKKEFRFELPTSALNAETENKTVENLHAWGGNNSSLRPNHKGWNMIGNPFLNSIVTDLAEPIRIDSLVKVLDDNGNWTGQWDVSNSERGRQFRYAVIPNRDEQFADAGYYESVVLDDIELKPFTSFFVQIGGTDPDANQYIRFNTSSRGPLMAPRRYSQYDEDEELFLRVKVDNWKTGCFISNKFTDEYEPGDDLESRYQIYQTIGGYKLLYSAINDSIIEHGVQVTTPQGMLYLDPKVNINKFEYIYVNYNDEWFDLKNGETVEVSGKFILQAKRKTQNTSTGMDEINDNSNFVKYIYNSNIYIRKNNHIFTVLGECVK